MNPNLRNLLRYFLVGGAAAGLNWLVFFVLFYALSLHYLLSATAAFILATALNFFLGKKFIFKDSRHSIFREGVLVYAASLAGLCVDLGVLFLCVEGLFIPALLAKIIATGAAFLVNFSLRQWVIYG